MAPDVTSLDDICTALESAGCRIKGKSCTCPWHDDKSPSASIIHDETGHYRVHCHVCKKTADVIDLVAEKNGVAVKDILKKTESKKQEEQVRRYSSIEDASERLASACGNVEAIYRYDMPGIDTPALVVIRIRQYDGKKTFRQLSHDGLGWVAKSPAKPWPLYRLPDIIGSRAVVVCEGEKAADAIRSIGLVATTSPCGAGKAEHADWSPLSGKRVVIWPDNDDTGKKHAIDVKDRLNALPTPPEMLRMIDPSTLDIPEKGDAVEAIAKIEGDKRDGIISILKAATECGKPTPFAAVKSAMDDEITGKSYLVPWPWPMLTRSTRSLLPGKVVLVAGPPGSAKSWFAMQCIIHFLETCVNVHMLALEETFPWYARRAMAWITGNLDSMHPEWAKANPEDAQEILAKHGDWIDALGKAYTCKSDTTMAGCAEWVDQKCKEGARVLFIDPITLADPGGMKPWDADRTFMAKVKATVEQHGASLVLITHPRKSQGQSKGGGLSMDDLAGGAAYQRAAASVLWIQGVTDDKDVRVEDIAGIESVYKAHKIITAFKTRDANGSGNRLAYSFHNCQFTELGRIV